MRGLRWPIAVGGLLLANVVAMVILAVCALHGGAQVIPGYYDQAVHYDDVIDEAARSDALHWVARATVVGGTIEVDVQDARGGPLDHASVRVDGYQRAHAAERFALTLAEIGGGRYRGVGAAAYVGRHDLRISVERGGEHYTQRATVEAR